MTAERALVLGGPATQRPAAEVGYTQGRAGLA